MATDTELTNEVRLHDGPTVTASVPESKLAYSYYVVVLLSITYMLSFMDRTLISLLIGPIKTEFMLTDTQMGALIGFGFVVFYSVLGLPFGALADRTNRKWLIISGLIAWSIATSASGFVAGFAGLLTLRALVGVGEATLSPSAYSTIADRFPPKRLGVAIAIYAVGVSLGGGLAMMFGGILVEWAVDAEMSFPLIGTIGGWRLALFVVGLLGFPLAIVMALTMREAPRLSRAAAPPLADLFRYIRARPKGMVGVLVAFSFANIANYVVFLWGAPLFMRVHGLDARTTGLMLGTIVAIFGSIGMLASGIVSDRLIARGIVDAPVRVTFWALIAQMPLMPLAFLVADTTLAFALMVPTMMLTTAASSVQGTALQLMTPSRMRGRVIALYLLVVTLVGMGIGPLMIGILSDQIFTTRDGLGDSMAVVAFVGLVISASLIFTVRHSIRAVMAEQQAASS